MEKDSGDKDNAEVRTALLKAKAEGAEGQAKILKEQANIVEVGARADFLTQNACEWSPFEGAKNQSQGRAFQPLRNEVNLILVIYKTLAVSY